MALVLAEALLESLEAVVVRDLGTLHLCETDIACKCDFCALIAQMILKLLKVHAVLGAAVSADTLDAVTETHRTEHKTKNSMMQNQDVISSAPSLPAHGHRTSTKAMQTCYGNEFAL